MRVLHVIARMNAGGTSQYLKALSQGLTQNGIENQIATGYVQTGEHEDDCVDGLPINRIRHLGRKISLANDFRAWRELREVISQYQPDIIHSHTFKAGLISRMIGSPARRAHTYHGHILNDGSLSWIKSQILIIIEKILARRTDVLVSVGKQVAEELQTIGIGGNASWVSIAPGIEKIYISPRSESSAKLGVNPDVKTVGWLGRMVDVKNPLLAIDVANLLPEYQFILAGDGYLTNECQSKAPSNMKLVGWVSNDQLLASIDILLMTSRSEGMPLAAIEAQMLGIPVVGTNVGSLPEVVINGKTGLITSADAKSLANSVKALLQDPSLYNSMSEQSKNLAKSRFTVERMIAAHLEMYESLNLKSKKK